MEKKKNRFAKAEVAKIILMMEANDEKQYRRALKAGKKPKKRIPLSHETKMDLAKVIIDAKETFEKKSEKLLLNVRLSFRKELAKCKNPQRNKRIEEVLEMSDNDLINHLPTVVSDENILEEYWAILDECGAKSAKLISGTDPTEHIKYLTLSI